MLQKKIFWTVALFFLPITIHAQVLLSEIAWMGTDADANNEWIEIYNFSTSPTDLSGWTLSSDDGAISVNLSGILPPHGVAVLERTDDDTLPSIPAFLLYTGGLSNDGGTLTIKDASGNISDQAVGGANWSGVGGSNTVPKKTAQRTRTGSWVTAAPTPGQQNAEQNDPDITNTTSETNTTNTESSRTTDTATRRGGGGSSIKKQLSENMASELTLNVEAPKTAYVNQPIKLTVEPSGVGPTIMNSLTYAWNFGDLHTDSGKAVTHTFAYPGEYVVFVSGSYAKRYAETRHEIRVLPATVSLTRTQNGDVVVKNTASYEVDMSGFKVLQGTKEIVFPEHTFIKGGGSITIPKMRVAGNSLILSDRKGALLASLTETAPTIASKPTKEKIVYQVVTPEDISMPENITLEEDFTDISAMQGEKIIAIGNSDLEEESPGFFARVMRKIGSFFNFEN